MVSDGTGESPFDSRTGQLARACLKPVGAVATAPGQQSKTSEHRKRLRRPVDITIRDATKDDCSIGILGRAATSERQQRCRALEEEGRTDCSSAGVGADPAFAFG